MNSIKRSLAFLLCALALCQARGQASARPANPYRLITDRNIFGLRQPPPPPSTKPTPGPMPQIILTGLSTITGRKLALLKLEFPPKPAQKQKEELCILKEGEANGPVRVLRIDMKAGSVEVDNSGTVDVLTFEKNGPKLQQPVASRRWPLMPSSALSRFRR